MPRWLKQVSFGLLCGCVGAAGAVVLVYLIYLRSRADLRPWHTARLASEFTARDANTVTNLAAYRALEDRLFAELQSEVYELLPPNERRRLNRYSAGSLADPARGATNWNRTYELIPPDPKGGVLLLHGLSDSPYSLRSLGERLYAQGYHVVGLRLPGHGTAPVALTRAAMEDFAAATRLAARDLRSRLNPQLPLFLAGYSNGGALAVDYALARLEGEDLPELAGIILISPAIGVSPAAALARWQRRLAFLPGLEKAAWTSVDPEYDPYKFNSFAVNAGEQIYRLTHRINQRLDRLDRGAGVTNFPPVLAFQSVVDSTIVPRAVIDRFLRRLAPGGHELVLFDIYRNTEARALMVEHPEEFTEALVADPQAPFAVTALTTSNPQSRRVRILRREANSALVSSQELARDWPTGIFSLSHVALPFAPNDPVYGDGSGAVVGAIHLGDVTPRGENGVLLVSPATLLRLRYNPFYDYLEERALSFIQRPPQ